MAVGCASNSPAKNSEINTANTTPKLLSTSDGLRLDTKLNIQFDWWKLLQSPQINALIEQGINANPTVEGAQSALLKLQQNDISTEGYFNSAISVTDAENGQGRMLFVQDVPLPNEGKYIGDAYYDVHAWQLAVGFVPEMLRLNQQAGSSKTEAEMQNFQLEATYRTLADNLIASALQDASLRAQMVAARKIIAIEQSLLSYTRKRFDIGLATQLEVNVREQSVEFSTQALQRLKAQFEQIHIVLRLLLNVPAESELPELVDLASLNLTAQLPLELSAALIEQRPDVRAAQLEMLPANTRYQNTADTALKDVEKTLFAIHNDAIALKAAMASVQDNMASLELARKKYEASKQGYLQVLIAEQGVQFARLRSAQTQAKYMGNAVVLYHALGGGWWAMEDAVRLEIDNELSQMIRTR